MRFRDGNAAQKALFCGLLGVYLLALLLRLVEDGRHFGQAHIGFHPIYDGEGNWTIHGIGAAATENGLYWGSQLVSFNGVLASELEPATGADHYTGADLYPGYPIPQDLIRTTPGEKNHIEFRCGITPQHRTVEAIDLPITRFGWRDVMCASGTPFLLGVIFVCVGVLSFLLRPYEHASWALLTFSLLFGAFISLVFRLSWYHGPIAFYTSLISSLFVLSPLYLGLASIVPHPLLVRRPWIVGAVFAPAAIIVGYAVLSPGDAYSRIDPALSGIMLIGTLFTITRTLTLALNGPSRIARQRARVVLLGCLGFLPPTVVWFSQQTFQTLMVDLRLITSTVLTFPIALAYTIVRHELFNTRVAVRRSAVYTAAAVVLVTLTTVLTTVLSGVLGAESRTWLTPAVIAVVLLPVLHYWPRIDDRLSNWLYPQRAHLPNIMQDLGEAMAACTTTEAILGVLARAPREVCDAQTGVAFIFAPDDERGQHMSACGPIDTENLLQLADRPLIQLLTATRTRIKREAIAVEPQYANIAAECYATMDALGADVLLPIIRQQHVIGALAVGPRASGDIFDPAELNVLSMLTQQAVQAIMRTEAFDTLHARQEDLAHLKHYLQPHVVDEIVEKGTDAALQGRRKMVTIFFSDLRGFTSFSDSVEPEEVMATLAEYHQAMGVRIAEYAGTLERFAGDGFMVFFNDPVEQPDHVQRAVRMAIAMRQDVQQLRDSWTRKGYHLHVGMGIHTGYATCGIVGYEGRREYAVIGNVTNLASRLCDAAAGGEILVTARVISELGTAFPNEPVGELTLKGFQERQLTYRILGAETHV